MLTFPVIKGWRWQIELRAVSVRRPEPEIHGGMYESLMAEVGGWSSHSVNDDAGSSGQTDRSW